MSSIDYSQRFPTTWTSAATARCSVPLESWQPNFIRWRDDWARKDRPTTMSIRTAVSGIRRAGQFVTTSRCVTIAGASS